MHPALPPGSLSVPGRTQHGQGSGLLVMWPRMDAGGAWILGAFAECGGRLAVEGERPGAAGGRRGGALWDNGSGTQVSVVLRARCMAAGELRVGGGMLRNGALGHMGRCVEAEGKAEQMGVVWGPAEVGAPWGRFGGVEVAALM